MQAVLLLCVSLVQGVVSTLQMIRALFHRDWHTKDAHAALPRETSDNHNKEQHSGPPGSRPAVDAQRREITPHDHAPSFILRDDRFAIPQDEACGCKSLCKVALILRGQCKALIVSKAGGVLAALSA